MRKRNLLACVKISNCFWKRHTVAKIDAHWAPSGNLRVFFSSKISWKRFSFYLKNYEEIRTSSLGQRSTPRRVSMTCWILFQSSLSSLSISKYSSVWNTMDRYPSSLSQRLKRCRIQPGKLSTDCTVLAAAKMRLARLQRCVAVVRFWVETLCL